MHIKILLRNFSSASHAALIAAASGVSMGLCSWTGSDWVIIYVVFQGLWRSHILCDLELLNCYAELDCSLNN